MSLGIFLKVKDMDLSKILRSSIQVEIISFFHRHPSTIDSVRGIATWVNHDIKDVEKALEELVSLNILIAHRTNYATAYAYTTDKIIISKIKKLFKENEKN